jgi:hypothetical protein
MSVDFPRSTGEVFEDHLRCRRDGAVEEDIGRNYSEGVVLLTTHGVYRGHEGVRQCVRLLLEQLPCLAYEYRTRLVEGEMAFLEWSARCAVAEVVDGADSFLIREGRIEVQTSHYTVRFCRPGEEGGEASEEDFRLPVKGVNETSDDSLHREGPQ